MIHRIVLVAFCLTYIYLSFWVIGLLTKEGRQWPAMALVLVPVILFIGCGYIGKVLGL